MTKNHKCNKPSATHDLSSTAWMQVRRAGGLLGALMISAAALVVSLHDPEMLLNGGPVTWSIVGGLILVGVSLLIHLRG